MKKAGLLLLILLCSFALVIAGCSGGEKASSDSSTNDSSSTNNDSQKSDAPKETVTIEFWHTYSDAEDALFNEQIIPLFEEQYSHIKVKATRMPYEGLKQQVIAGVAGDAAPDLMRMDLIWVPEFAKLGALMPLDDKEGFADIKGKVFEGALATNFYNGKYYGLPLNTNTKVGIYNKELLAAAGLSEAPKTFDELISAAEALKAQGKFGLGLGGSGTWAVLPYFWTFGGNITDDGYTKASGYLNSEESVAALQKIADLNTRGLVAPSILGGEPGTWDGIQNGDYFMIDDGPWFYSILGQGALDKTVVAPLPTGEAGSLSIVGGEDLVIFTNSKHPDEAWTFAQFLMTEEPQKIMAQTGLIPTNIQAANSDEVLAVEFIEPYIEQLQTAKPRTPHPNWNKIDESLGIAFERVFRGEATPQEALDQAAKEIDGFLQQ